MISTETIDRRFATCADAKAFGARVDVPWAVNRQIEGAFIQYAHRPRLHRVDSVNAITLQFCLFACLNQVEIRYPKEKFCFKVTSASWPDYNKPTRSNLTRLVQCEAQHDTNGACYILDGAKNSVFEQCAAEGKRARYGWHITDYPKSTIRLTNCWCELDEVDTVIRYKGHRSMLIVDGLHIAVDTKPRMIIDATGSTDCRIVYRSPVGVDRLKFKIPVGNTFEVT